MKLSFATMCVGALLAGAFESRALTFEGTISGSVTFADNASFLIFGNNPPLTVGDTITGQYSYESSTVDGRPSTSHFKINIGTIVLGFQPYVLNVSDGHIDSMFWVDNGVGVFGQDLSSFFISVDENGFSISELIQHQTSEERRSASGQLTFSDPVPQTVPDTTATGLLLACVLGVLWYFRRQLNRA